ncbi:hypothetical protein B0H11DRAFT_2074486 [Mycena galericulata]|nr:hypothetical protein B0H11DRAFT_2116942 [Mycena galericulata]KAJ7452140.1 hypothetical protein B0H11DRAFT_2074486 [Mycena galericulata]
MNFLELTLLLVPLDLTSTFPSASAPSDTLRVVTITRLDRGTCCKGMYPLWEWQQDRIATCSLHRYSRMGIRP